MGACCRKDAKTTSIDDKEEHFVGNGSQFDAPVEEKTGKPDRKSEIVYTADELRFFDIAASVKTNNEVTDVYK